MAKRIGKYKITKREAELSAVDGATIQGSLDGITNLTATGTSALAVTTVSSTLGVTGATTLSGTAGVKGATAAIYADSGVVTSGATFNSGAMTVPAGSIIVDMGCVVKTALAAASGVFGVRFGTTANAVDLAALDADGLEGSGTTVAVGIGTAMDAVLQTALGGTAVVIMDVGDAYRATATAVHGSVLSAGGSITGGNITFWVKYISIV